MAAKSHLSPEYPPVPDFPKLMISNTGNKKVVLFTRSGQGVVVYKGTGGDDVGHYYTEWNPSSFVDYNGNVVLSNNT